MDPIPAGLEYTRPAGFFYGTDGCPTDRVAFSWVPVIIVIKGVS